MAVDDIMLDTLHNHLYQDLLLFDDVIRISGVLRLRMLYQASYVYILFS